MAEEKQYDILTTMHGSFKTTFTKKHLARKPWQPENPKHIKSNIPGTIVKVCVTEGQEVKAGDILLVFKAMKMNSNIRAAQDGKVKKIDVKEGDYHYDESDQCYPWIRVYCEGNLACGLDDWEIIRVEPYSKKRAPPNSLSDALVPFIPYDQLDKVATEFLKDHYKDALKVTPYGQPPVMVDPLVLAHLSCKT